MAPLADREFRTLIECRDLAVNMSNPQWVVVDCRFSLDDADRGRRAYLESHIPGAVYAHLNEDLSGPIISGKTGRHPLPDVADFSYTLSRLGIGNDAQVVVYDDSSGVMAARLWWMLRWLGHNSAAVLNGGWSAWSQGGFPVGSGEEHRPKAKFLPHPRPELVLGVEQVRSMSDKKGWRLIDARAAERYRGEVEPIDPVGGHIPGALNVPFTKCIEANGVFRAPEVLRQEFGELVAGVAPEQVVFYCGSGVTAGHSALAFAHAGLGEARIYPGSWSEWIVDPQRPIERGAPPCS